MTTTRSLVPILALFVGLSCRPDDQRTDSIDPLEAMQARENMPPDAVAQLDSGSAAFRRHDFDAALVHYTRVTELAPDLAAGWFGVHMAQDALGNQEAAEEALRHVRELLPGATLLHENGPDTPR